MRPKDYNPKIPDPKEHRCLICNPYGFNRCGLRFVRFSGASTTTGYGVKCEGKNCKDGWID